MRSRKAVIQVLQSWIGKNEADGSYKSIIDIYNSYEGTLPRNTRMSYDWPWCAATWSAAAVKLGYTDIMPIEISCYYLIEAAKKMGCWIENDAYIPQMADAVLYDWDDTGAGDNQGVPDHIGTVEKVVGNTIVVIEGNFTSNSIVGRRYLEINGRYIRGFICPKYDEESGPDIPEPERKTIPELAKEVIHGLWGNGEERKQRLEAAGYDYKAVQAEVDRILSGETDPPQKTIEEIAAEVIEGLWGNGEERKQRLEAAGYDYNKVQEMVDQLLR